MDEPAGVRVDGTRVPGRVHVYGRYRGESLPMTDEQRAAYVAALVRERATYLERGDAGRLGQVEAELARVGAQGLAPRERATTRAKGAEDG